MAKIGRPTKYRDTFPVQAEVACREGGFTSIKLAKLFSVSIAAIELWQRTYPDFIRAIKRGKDDFNVATAENCLKKRLEGYQYDEVTKELVKDENGKTLQVTKVVTKSVAPDVTALIFFLKNRNRERWNDKKDVDLNVTGIDQILAGLKTAPLVEDE
ncbi:MAG: hypothetical protein U9N63_14805 [Pseudomonadota bacterium]|nr:hypothetical protein [Pseudomonadota bacterium]